MLSGKKTYIMGFVSIVTAVGTWLSGDLSLEATIQVVVTSGLAMFIRDGVNTAAAK